MPASSNPAHRPDHAQALADQAGVEAHRLRRGEAQGIDRPALGREPGERLGKSVGPRREGGAEAGRGRHRVGEPGQSRVGAAALGREFRPELRPPGAQEQAGGAALALALVDEGADP
jgi:hypothetical protein